MRIKDIETPHRRQIETIADLVFTGSGWTLRVALQELRDGKSDLRISVINSSAIDRRNTLHAKVSTVAKETIYTSIAHLILAIP